MRSSIPTVPPFLRQDWRRGTGRLASPSHCLVARPGHGGQPAVRTGETSISGALRSFSKPRGSAHDRVDLPEQLPGNVTFQAAANLAAAFAFSGSALDIFLRCGVAAHPHARDDI
jgi:hypothetical protein